MSGVFPPKGQPPILSVETKKERVNMISALSCSGEVRYMLYEDSMNQQRVYAPIDPYLKEEGFPDFGQPKGTSRKNCYRMDIQAPG